MRDEKKEKLKEYSKAAREAIAERFPELADGWNEEPDGSLSFTMIRPSGKAFYIDTSRMEVIVGFGFAHYHFGAPWESKIDPVEDVGLAESFIRELLTGRYDYIEWRRKGKYIQSMLVDPGTDPATIPRTWLGRWWTRGCTVDVFSWA